MQSVDPPSYHCQPSVTAADHYNTHTRLTALFPGLPRWAGIRKVKPIWILLKQETESGSGISWAICKSAPCSSQIPTPAPPTLFFTGRMPFLPPNQQRQSTEGKMTSIIILYNSTYLLLLLHMFNGLCSTTTWVSRYQKGKASPNLNKARNDRFLVST